MRTSRRKAQIDVYASWFLVNFITGLIPIGLIYWLHNSALLSSAMRDIISSYLAYMTTLLVVSLYFDEDEKGFYRLRRRLAELLAGILYTLYVIYNVLIPIHQGVNNNAWWVLTAIYCGSGITAFFLNRNLLNDRIDEQLAKQPFEEAKGEVAAVKDIGDELSREDQQ